MHNINYKLTNLHFLKLWYWSWRFVQYLQLSDLNTLTSSTKNINKLGLSCAKLRLKWLACWGWANVVFHRGAFHLFKIVLDSTRVNLQMLLSKFCWFQANKVVFHWGRLPLRSSSTEVVFHWGLLPLRLSSTEVIFHWGRLPLRLSSTKVVFHWGCLPLRLSSTEVVFHGGRLPFFQNFQNWFRFY